MTMQSEVILPDRKPSHGLALTQALPLAKVLHWVTAVLIFSLFLFGVLMTQLGVGPVSEFLYTAHKTMGFGVILLLAVRLTYRFTSTVAGRWRGSPRGKMVHWIVYGLTFLVAMLGWAAVSDFGARGLFLGLSLPSIWPEGAGHSAYFFPAHAWLAFLLMALILVHIGIALNDFVTRRAE